MNVGLKVVNFERYRDTAMAIGLIEMFGNTKPNSRQVDIAERLIKHFGFTWEDCVSETTLKRALIRAALPQT